MSGSCYVCGRPFQWRAPGEHGIEQGWYRHHQPGDRGRPRCADETACANWVEQNPRAVQDSLFAAD